MIRDDFLTAFKEIDLILAPTSPTTAFKFGDKMDDPLAMYLVDVYTTSLNLAGLPGISVPVGNSSEGLPIGVQLIGKPFEETELLQAAARVEELVSS